MGADLSIVLQTSVNAPDSIVQNHQRIIADLKKKNRRASAGKRGESYTFSDDPMNYVELRVMAAADARAYINGDSNGNARAISLERAGAGGNRVLMLEPSCDTNAMSGVSSDVAGMATRARGYAELRLALKDPLMAGRVGIAIDASVKLGNRIPGQSGRFTQCISLLLANVLLAAEGGGGAGEEAKRHKSPHYTLPGVTLYVLDMRECGLTDESAPWVAQDLMERVKRVFRYYTGLRLQQLQKHRQQALFPGAAALGVYAGTPRNAEEEQEVESALQHARDVTIQLPVFTKDTRGDLFCCSLQHVLLANNPTQIGGVLKVVNTLLESVAPKGYAPKGEDWMLLPYLCLIDMQKQDVLPSEIRQYLLEYVPPTKQVVILISGTPEAEWQSTKEKEEADRRAGVVTTTTPRSRSRASPSRHRSTSVPREKRDKPEDFKQVFVLQDRGPSLENDVHLGDDEGSSQANPTAPSTAMNIDFEEEEGEQKRGGGDEGSSSASSSVVFEVEEEEVDNVAPPAPPPMAPTPLNSRRASTQQQQQQQDRRERPATSAPARRSHADAPPMEQQRRQDEAAAALERQIRVEEDRLRQERQRLEDLRRQREEAARAVEAEADQVKRLRAERDEKLNALQSERQDLQKQQREMYEEQERENLEAQLERRRRRQLLPQDQQVVILREKPPQRSAADKQALEERLQQLFEEEQAIYREYKEAVDTDEDRERAYAERLRDSQRQRGGIRDRNATEADLAAEARRWLRGDRSTPIFSSQPSSASRMRSHSSSSSRPSSATKPTNRARASTPRGPLPATQESQAKVEASQEVPVNSAQPSPSAVRPSLSRGQTTEPSVPPPSQAYEAKTYSSTEEEAEEADGVDIPQATRRTERSTAKDGVTSSQAVRKRPPSRSPVQRRAVTQRSRPQRASPSSPHPPQSASAAAAAAPTDSPQEGEERSPTEHDAAYPPELIDTDTDAVVSSVSSPERREEADEAPADRGDGADDDDDEDEQEERPAPRTAAASFPPVADEAHQRPPTTTASAVSVSSASFVSPTRPDEPEEDAEDDDDDAVRQAQADGAASPQESLAKAASAYPTPQKREPSRSSSGPRERHEDPRTAPGAEAPFYDPGMYSLRPSGPRNGFAGRHRDQQPPQARPAPSTSASPSPRHAISPRRSGSSSHHNHVDTPRHPPPHHQSHPHPRALSSSSLSPPPPALYDDPDQPDAARARARERRAARYRDRRYDTVSPRIDNRWPDGREGPTPPPGYDPVESPKARATSPRASAYAALAKGDGPQVRATSPHPGTAAPLSARRVADHTSSAHTPSARARRQGREEGGEGAACSTPSRGRQPIGPPADTVASRARRAASQRRRSELEKDERSHPVPHQPRINRSSSTRGMSAAVPQSMPFSHTNRRTTNTVSSASREESPVPKSVMVSTHDMMAAAGGAAAGAPAPHKHLRGEDALSILSSSASLQRSGNVNGMNASSGRGGSHLMQTPSEARGIRRQGGASDSPPGWAIPLVNEKLRTQRPSR